MACAGLGDTVGFVEMPFNELSNGVVKLNEGALRGCEWGGEKLS